MAEGKKYTYRLLIYLPAEWRGLLKEKAREKGFRTVGEMIRYLIRRHVLEE